MIGLVRGTILGPPLDLRLPRKLSPMIRIAVFTQDERVYLPRSIGILVEAMPEAVACIVLSPPMSTHGGLLKGVKRHLPVFGLWGTLRMVAQVLWCRVGSLLRLPAGPQRKYWSIRNVGEKHQIPVHDVPRVNSPQMQAILDEVGADLLVSVSCPQVIKSDLLARFKLGGINVHSAPLTKYRGIMPAFWILLNRERETAVTVHDLADRLDNGDIIHQEMLSVSSSETWHSLVSKTKKAAGHALVRAIGQISAGSVVRRPNLDEESTYFSFPRPEDARKFRLMGLRMF